MKKRPNIVFILSDDQGAWAMHCAGNSEIITPNLDRIASNGVRFENFFCASPVCSPARGSILTGTMPSVHGIQDWLRGGNINMADFPELKDNPIYASEHEAIPYLEGITCYTDVLAENGYTCALSGKWHMGDSVHPQHGFSHWFTIARGGCRYFHPDVVENGKVTFPEKYITEIITDDALSCIEELSQKEEPFYLSVHYTAPHSPWSEENHPKQYLDLYRDSSFESVPNEPVHPWLTAASPYKSGEEGRRENLRGYFAAITAMDHEIGKILDKLEEKEILDDTIVIFTGDNGMSMGHHGVWGKGNGTFPQNMYDSAVKVPFIISWKNHIPSGTVEEAMASHYDIFPTLLDYAGITVPENAHHLPGKSIRSILEGKKDEERPVVVFDEYGPTRMIRSKDWKLVLRLPFGPDELYDLNHDPGEKENLIDNPGCRTVRYSMTKELMEWFNRYIDPLRDGSKEANTGYGQLTRVGIERSNGPVFAVEESYRKAVADAWEKLSRPLDVQP